MKKILILAVWVGVAYMANATNVEQARMNLGYELNQTVNVLKDYFRTVKTQLEEDLDAVNKINAEVDALSDKSKDKESNHTVLPQGKSLMPSCKYNEELRWNNDQWKCERPSYSSDCDPAPGEVKQEISGKGQLCKQNGNLIENNLGYGVCNDRTGERKTQIECLFKNSATGKEYQIANTNCSPSKYTRYRQPCGANGDKSSCKCPNGLVYVYIKGKGGRCVYDFTYEVDGLEEDPRSGRVPVRSDSKGVYLEFPAKEIKLNSINFNTLWFAHTCRDASGWPSPNYRITLFGKYVQAVHNMGGPKIYGGSMSFNHKKVTNAQKVYLNLSQSTHPRSYTNYFVFNKRGYKPSQGRETRRWGCPLSNVKRVEPGRGGYAIAEVDLIASASWIQKIPKMKWVSHSTGANINNAVCVEGKETRMIEGIPVTADCWRKQIETDYIHSCPI